MRMVFDTETTGLPLWREPSNHPGQPHLVQFAAILLEDDGTERAAVSVMVKPEGWIIPDGTAAIHGITTETATLYGVPENTIVRMFLDMVDRADIVVAAFNESFDWRMMRIAMLRYGMEKSAIETIEQCKRVCAMKLADQIMQLPPTDKMLAAGFKKSKAPNLMEAHQHFIGEPFDKAHDALADVRATARVWHAINELAVAGSAK